jgi:RNA polymerase sigma factor (sigma-70 family)
MSTLRQTAAPLAGWSAPRDPWRAAPQPWYSEGSAPPFLIPLDLINDVVGVVTRRRGMTPADTEDFRSWTYEKLLSNDCKALRSFTGRSSLRTYLYAVISNLLRDYRCAHFRSRWRQPAGVARLGRWAVTLDRLVNRDNVPGEEAVRTVASRADCDVSESELRKLLLRIPRRPRPCFVPLEAAAEVVGDGGGDPEAAMLAAERARARRAIVEKLNRALEGFDAEDRNVIQLRFWRGLTIAEVSRRLGIPQKPLYGRLERCLERLRASLESQGISGPDIQSVLAPNTPTAEIS